MSIIWLLVLLVYGLAAGWDRISDLHWLLVIPFFLHDIYEAWSDPHEKP